MRTIFSVTALCLSLGTGFAANAQGSAPIELPRVVIVENGGDVNLGTMICEVERMDITPAADIIRGIRPGLQTCPAAGSIRSVGQSGGITVGRVGTLNVGESADSSDEVIVALRLCTKRATDANSASGYVPCLRQELEPKYTVTKK